MQLTVPEVADLSSEPAHILKLYGADETGTKVKELRAAYARNCILARRLVEKGVRFVQLFNGAYQTGGEGVSNWDGHKELVEQYSLHGPVLDQPTAGLLTDLKQRGLLDDTLVVWCTEFGRMPTFQKGAQGRDHNPPGFTCWLAGAGVSARIRLRRHRRVRLPGRRRMWSRCTTFTRPSCTCSASITCGSRSITTAWNAA